jgi:carbonic anhydrase/acetyltransferase-like protein (isoleucine patch superfamily)
MGNPAKVVRKLTPGNMARIRKTAEGYIKLKKQIFR